MIMMTDSCQLYLRPPERNIGHTIPLEPGSKPLSRHAYRLSTRELAEAKLADVIAHGHVGPSKEP